MNVATISTTAAETLTPPESKAPDTVELIKTRPARDFRKLLEETAGHDMLVHKARGLLREAAKKVFAHKVTVAFAAASLGIDLSVKGLDREDTDARAWVQRLRVTLHRALTDANLLKTDANRGRKARARRAATVPDADAILAVLPNLLPADIDRIAVAVTELLTAQIKKVA